MSESITELAAAFGAVPLTAETAEKAAQLVAQSYPVRAAAHLEEGPDALWYVVVADDEGIWYLWFEHSVHEYLQNPGDLQRAMACGRLLHNKGVAQ